MARSQHRSQKKVSGGRYRPLRTKKKYELAGYPVNTKLSAEAKTQKNRVMGGNYKYALLQANKVNVADTKGKIVSTEIVNVVDNPANPNLVRRNVITKGAIVETKFGRVRVTSRPGQEGTVNGVLVK